MFTRFALATMLAAALSSAALAQTSPLTPTKDMRCAPSTTGQCTQLVPATDLAKARTMPLPQDVEQAFLRGYGTLRFKLMTTGGFEESGYCSAGLYDKRRRLVVSSHHCLPEYVGVIDKSEVTFRGVTAKYLMSIAEADLALFQIESVPEGMEEFDLADAIVGEPIFTRSVQETVVFDPSHGKQIPMQILFTGTVSADGQVFAKSNISVRFLRTKGNTRAVLPVLEPTSYEILRLRGDVGEYGFSGGAIFNEFGQVLGVVMGTAFGATPTSSMANHVFASGAINIKALLNMYKE